MGRCGQAALEKRSILKKEISQNSEWVGGSEQQLCPKQRTASSLVWKQRVGPPTHQGGRDRSIFRMLAWSFLRFPKNLFQTPKADPREGALQKRGKVGVWEMRAPQGRPHLSGTSTPAVCRKPLDQYHQVGKPTFYQLAHPSEPPRSRLWWPPPLRGGRVEGSCAADPALGGTKHRSPAGHHPPHRQPPSSPSLGVESPAPPRARFRFSQPPHPATLRETAAVATANGERGSRCAGAGGAGPAQRGLRLALP